MTLSEEQERNLTPIVKKTLSDPTLSATKKIGLVLNEVQRQGLPVASELIHLLRGQLFLEEHIDNLNSELEILDPQNTLQRFSIKKNVAKAGALGVLKDINRFILSQPHRTLTADLVTGLTWEINKELFLRSKKALRHAWVKTCAGLMGRIAEPHSP